MFNEISKNNLVWMNLEMLCQFGKRLKVAPLCGPSTRLIVHSWHGFNAIMCRHLRW